jgi:hypothetical protein
MKRKDGQCSTVRRSVGGESVREGAKYRHLSREMKADKDSRLTNYKYDNLGRKTQEKWMSGGTAIYTANFTYDAGWPRLLATWVYRRHSQSAASLRSYLTFNPNDRHSDHSPLQIPLRRTSPPASGTYRVEPLFRLLI